MHNLAQYYSSKRSTKPFSFSLRSFSHHRRVIIYVKSLQRPRDFDNCLCRHGKATEIVRRLADFRAKTSKSLRLFVSASFRVPREQRKRRNRRSEYFSGYGAPFAVKGIIKGRVVKENSTLNVSGSDPQKSPGIMKSSWKRPSWKRRNFRRFIHDRVRVELLRLCENNEAAEIR